MKKREEETKNVKTVSRVKKSEADDSEHEDVKVYLAFIWLHYLCITFEVLASLMYCLIALLCFEGEEGKKEEEED